MARSRCDNSELTIPTVATAAALTGAALYADGKYHIRNDLAFLDVIRRMITAPKWIAEQTKLDRLLVYHVLEDHAKADRPNHLFLEFEGRSWTYKEFFDDLQRVGNWLMNDLAIQKGEIVAIDGPNSAEYMMLWFALDGIGAAPAFINCNLNGAALEHCVKVCKSKHLIADRAVEGLVEPSRKTFESSNTRISYFDEGFFQSLTDRTPIPRQRNSGIMPEDIKCLIYTSGTTGFPKATILTTGRFLLLCKGGSGFLGLKQSDKFYTCLPLYHGSAISLCTTPAIWSGSSVALGRKFSHKTFWPEVSASGANILQYVGELCRYLVNAPPHELERKHNVQMAWGNGMRPDVWETFRQRFNIPIIHELYAATDGLGPSFNRNRGEFSRGAVAVRGILLRALLSRSQIRAKIDPDTEEILRGPNGFIIQCKAGEPGEMLNKVEESMKEEAFRGYYNNSASGNKRWMRDVLKPGDLWFRSGDVLREDADGRSYFVDRLGDTFRWKSENVSTNEVSDTLGTHPHVAECNVYGVAVPNADGRCGCATIVLAEGITLQTLDFGELARHVTTRLPRYAVPLFLRIAPALQYTGTFKVQKGQAKREGIDLDLIEKSGSKDSVFWLPPGSAAYQPFNRADLQALRDGTVNL